MSDELNNWARAQKGKTWKQLLWEKQDHRCCWCGRFLVLVRATIEHIIPKSLGGTNDFVNLAVAHHLCNQTRRSNLEVEPHPSASFDFVRKRIQEFKAGTVAVVPERLEWRDDNGDIVGIGGFP